MCACCGQVKLPIECCSQSKSFWKWVTCIVDTNPFDSCDFRVFRQFSRDRIAFNFAEIYRHKVTQSSTVPETQKTAQNTTRNHFWQNIRLFATHSSKQTDLWWMMTHKFVSFCVIAWNENVSRHLFRTDKRQRLHVKDVLDGTHTQYFGSGAKQIN